MVSIKSKMMDTTLLCIGVTAYDGGDEPLPITRMRGRIAHAVIGTAYLRYQFRLSDLCSFQTRTTVTPLVVCIVTQKSYRLFRGNT